MVRHHFLLVAGFLPLPNDKASAGAEVEGCYMGLAVTLFLIVIICVVPVLYISGRECRSKMGEL